MPTARKYFSVFRFQAWRPLLRQQKRLRRAALRLGRVSARAAIRIKKAVERSASKHQSTAFALAV
jgi:hypothetical protein